MEFFHSLWHLVWQSIKDYCQQMGWLRYSGISVVLTFIWTWAEKKFTKDEIWKICKRFFFINAIIFSLIIVTNIYGKVQQLKLQNQKIASTNTALNIENEKLKTKRRNEIKEFNPKKIKFFIKNIELSENSDLTLTERWTGQTASILNQQGYWVNFQLVLKIDSARFSPSDLSYVELSSGKESLKMRPTPYPLKDIVLNTCSIGKSTGTAILSADGYADYEKTFSFTCIEKW